MMLKEGKPPREILENIVYRHLSFRDPDLVIGPAIGEDAGIVRLSDGFLVSHSNPITVASRFAGWLSVHVACNDVAVRGAKPRWLLTTILLSPGTREEELEEIVRQTGEAAKSIDTVIIGGHTETTPGLPRTIIVTTAIGYTKNRVIKTRDAMPGDKVIVVGPIGGEGASVIAWDFEDELRKKGIDEDIIEKAKSFVKNVSVVDKALKLAPYVSSMHNPTEGGILEGLLEVAIASNNTIVVDLGKIDIDPVVMEVTKPFKIDPLKLLSSGSLIATIPEYNLEKALSILEKNNVSYSICGEVKSGPPVLVVRRRDKEDIISETIIDEIYKIWS